MYDAACTFWAELFGCFQHALAVLNVKELNKRVTARNRGLAPEERAAGHPAGRVMTHYWGCHQRFFRQLCMAIKVRPHPNPNPNPTPNPGPNPNPYPYPYPYPYRYPYPSPGERVRAGRGGGGGGALLP